MASKFGWIDFSEKERRQMLDVVNLFSERDTRDELGIGTIRDAFADHFFPGTSTIQTRAKYMLLIPWIYMDLERKKVPSSAITVRARRIETRIISALMKNGEDDGVIGKEAKQSLVRLPSNIYWSGLYSWGIRLFPGSQAQYHRSLDVFYKLNRIGPSKESDEENADHQLSKNWHPAIPSPPENLIGDASLKLSRQEASYLKERVLLSHPESLLAEMLNAKRAVKADFPWEHPTATSIQSELSENLMHAHNFSEIIQGAALLYNLMLSKAAEIEDMVSDYENRLVDWAAGLGARNSELKGWYKNISDFWACEALRFSKVPPRTRSFVNRWLDLVFSSPGAGKVAWNKSARNIIAAREDQLKGPRARLTNQSALNRWRGESGTKRLTYRWKTASTFVFDIINGLRGA